MCKSRRWWKPTKHCEVVRSSGCVVVRWQKSSAKTRRNWAELHSDILLIIFEKLGAIDILTTASLVCQNWNRLTWSEQMLWQRIDMTNHDFSLSRNALKQIAKIAIDRSVGKLEEFYADGLATDDLLLYIAMRTNSLKSIGLFWCPGISIEGLMAMAQRTKTLRTLRLIKCLSEDYPCPDDFANIIKMLPMLEELEITCTVDSTKLCKTIGPVCTELKCFRWNNIWYSRCSSRSFSFFEYDTEALQIGKNMHELRSLQLIGNEMTNRGLEAILEGCPYLEFLDIRNCFNLVLNENIMTKLSRIRYLKLPDNFADDYMNRICPSGDYYYNYYFYGRTCLCCFDSDDEVLLTPHDGYDNYYYDTFSTLDDIYGDVMFLY